MFRLFAENRKSIPKFLSGKKRFEIVKILKLTYCFPYGVMFILGLFSLSFYIVYYSENRLKIKLSHMGNNVFVNFKIWTFSKRFLPLGNV